MCDEAVHAPSIRRCDVDVHLQVLRRLQKLMLEAHGAAEKARQQMATATG
jgi:hypothetical protein